MTNNESARARIARRRVRVDLDEAVSSRVRRSRNAPESEDSLITPLGGRDTVAHSMLRGMRRVMNTFRDGEHLHVSDVIGKCLRQIALSRDVGLRPSVRDLRDSEAITFRMGSALHDMVRDRFAENAKSTIYGRWRCPCAHTTTDARTLETVGKKHTCTKCGHVPFIYVEVEIEDDEYGLTGSPDLLLLLPEVSALHVVEIKSISGKGFTELSRAMPDHVIQCLFYWHLMKRARKKITDKISILYVNKEYSFKDPYREFVIDAAAAEHRLADYIEDLKAFRSYVGGNGGPLPYRGCPTIGSPAAKDCSVRVSCFSM